MSRPAGEVRGAVASAASAGAGLPAALPCGASVVVVAAAGVGVVGLGRLGAHVTRYRSFGGGGGDSSPRARSGRAGEASCWPAAATGDIGGRLASTIAEAPASTAVTRRPVSVRQGAGRVLRRGKDVGKSLMR